MSEAEPGLSKYLHTRGAQLGIPVSGNFELTPRCNFNCKMCYVHSNELKDTLTADDWLALAAEAKKAGTVFLLLTGGEPLMRPDFDEIYSQIVKMGFLVSINSNGSLIKNHIELFKKYPPSRVNISLYGSNDSVYRELCGSESYCNVIEGIKLLKDANIGVRLNAVFTSFNAEDADNIIALSKTLGVQLKPTAYAYPPVRLGDNTGSNKARLSAKDAGFRTVQNDKQLFDSEFYTARAKALLDGKINIGDGCVKEMHMRCRAGKASFWITHDGKMRPCGMMLKPQTNPLEEGFLPAWNHLRQLVDEILLPKECSVCAKRDICPVCAAMCFAETGSFDGKPQYVCDMIDSVIENTSKELSRN